AMLGRIMPAPLLMPVMVTAAPSIATCRLKALGTVSVVMMACAACSQWSGPASARAAGRPASMRSTGNGSMITPVENGSTCSVAMSRCRASAVQLARARTSPSSPVPALALPVLMTSARISPRVRWSRHTWTGAAQKRFCVNTPATDAPASINTTARSVRSALRMPACATPTRMPGTGCRSAARGVGRLTAIYVALVGMVERCLSALAPGQAAEAPAAAVSTLGILVRVPLETFEDVVGLDAKLAGSPGRGNRMHAAAAEQHGLLARRDGGFDPFIEGRVQRHAGPLLPGQRHRTGHKTNPFAFGVATHVDQHRRALLPPVERQLRRNVAGITLGRARLQRISLRRPAAGGAGVVPQSRGPVGRHGFMDAL